MKIIKANSVCAKRIDYTILNWVDSYKGLWRLPKVFIGDAFARIALKRWSLQVPKALVDGPNHLIVYTPERLLKYLWVRIDGTNDGNRRSRCQLL